MEKYQGKRFIQESILAETYRKIAKGDEMNL
jgi:hypothetical protein